MSPREYMGVFDKLFDDDETFNVGSLNASAIYFPGHTPDHMGYKIGGKIMPASPKPQPAKCDFQTTFLWEIPFSILTLVLPAPTFQVAAQKLFSPQGAES